jgi:cephalosporin-C deacetylase
MALFDLTTAELYAYRPAPQPPTDFEDFWKRTLSEAAELPLDPAFEHYDACLPAVEVFDVRFSGWGGHRIAAWLILPADGRASVPCVVQYLGYNSGRGIPLDHTFWAAAGYALLLMDTRGVSGLGGLPGSTADPVGGGNPQVPGFLTRGVLDPHDYYYRRVFTDAVRAVETAAVAPRVDASSIVLAGGSQGGAIAQAAAGLSALVGRPPAAALVDVPFLTHIRRAIEITDAEPYKELIRFLATQRDVADRTLATLDYFDGLNLAALGNVPALYSAALRDPVCPPSTVFAAFNAWQGTKEISVWPFNEHEGGGSQQRVRQLQFLKKLL